MEDNHQLERIKTLTNDNIRFIDSFSIEEWQQYLKDIMCSTFPLLNEDAYNAIQSIKDFHIKLSDNKINNISCMTDPLNGTIYEGVLNICYVTVTENKNGSSKELLNVPIECLRLCQSHLQKN